MSIPWYRSPWIIAAAMFLAFFWQLGALPLLDVDEGAFSEATREMLASGNFVSPHLDGEPRHDKPILTYWLQASSVALFGLNEFALRLPSAIAVSLWLLALFRFSTRHIDRDAAAIAVLLMALSLQVGIIAKGAIADGVLNLLLALTLLEIYAYGVRPRRGPLLRAFLWMGLGFLTKGPVSVVLPFIISALYFGIAGRWRDWLQAIFHPLGWLLFLAVVTPWHVAVYLDQGTAFFEGFYLGHNLSRYTDTMEGHGGTVFYYLVAVPLIVLPFSGWLLAVVRGLGSQLADPLDRFLWLWFGVVFAFFSLSSTQLPHYLLYGCSPLFILLARHRARLANRWLAFLSPLLFTGLLLALPYLFAVLESQSTRLHEQTLFAAGQEAFAGSFQLLAGVALAVTLAIALTRRLPPWQGLLLVGFLQIGLVSGLILPRVGSEMQGPVKEAAAVARAEGGEVVRYRIRMPSFSVYREAPTPNRNPRPGDLVFTRIDRVEELRRRFPGDRSRVLFERGIVALIKVEAGHADG